jgi:hypothetical protein
MHGNARKGDSQTAEQQAEYVIIETRKSKLLLPKPAGAFSNA